MSILSLVLVIIVSGVLLYLVERYVPMDAMFKRILSCVVVFAVVLWLLTALGIINAIKSITIPRVG